jgi:hypothetical protein
MATGIIGLLSGVGTITYTPNSAAKVKMTYSGGNGYTLNGVDVVFPAGTSMELYVGGGQTLTISSILGTNAAGGRLIVSALES